MVDEKGYRGYTVKEMPDEDRPQEKLLIQGPEVLTNAELIALIIRTGTKKESSISLAQKLINSLHKVPGEEKSALSQLAYVTLQDLKKVEGIGDAKASMILAAIELGKRMHTMTTFDRIKVTSPEKAASFVMGTLRFSQVEEFVVLLLNTKKEVCGIEYISKGTVDCTVVHPREVFGVAVEKSAHSIILVHNHPTGDVNPSREDKLLTKRLREGGELLGIPVLDHIIIGNGVYYSFLEENCWE
ncbi:MAG: DNA repair protein RadC [Tissierellia bacterium]|nr:DNA repair protein RadC [Tissierellia bacterium]